MGRSEAPLILLALALSISSVQSRAATIRVPLDQATIQAGINAAGEGDTVLVAPGTYTGAANRELDFGGTNMVVMSEAGADQTTIDCESMNVAFAIWRGEDSTSVIRGFTIVNGNGGNGGGIVVNNATPTIENCVFYGNVAFFNGGGIYYSYTPAQGVIRGCVFYGNTATSRGGGIECDHASARISGCLFYENTVTTTTSLIYYGGGGLHGNSSTVTVTNCTFVRNAASVGSGGVYSYAGNITVEKSIVAFSTEGPGLSVDHVAQCVVFGNAGGDSLSWDNSGILFVDPLFCDVASDDYTLCANSPCLPGSSTNPWGVLLGALGQGCDDCEAAVESSSWGRVKGIFK